MHRSVLRRLACWHLLLQPLQIKLQQQPLPLLLLILLHTTITSAAAVARFFQFLFNRTIFRAVFRFKPDLQQLVNCCELFQQNFFQTRCPYCSAKDFDILNSKVQGTDRIFGDIVD